MASCSDVDVQLAPPRRHCETGAERVASVTTLRRCSCIARCQCVFRRYDITYFTNSVDDELNDVTKHVQVRQVDAEVSANEAEANTEDENSDDGQPATKRCRRCHEEGHNVRTCSNGVHAAEAAADGDD